MSCSGMILPRCAMASRNVASELKFNSTSTISFRPQKVRAPGGSASVSGYIRPHGAVALNLSQQR
jgi:hypothetical protein